MPEANSLAYYSAASDTEEKGAKTHSMTTFSMTTFSITTPRIMESLVLHSALMTLSINDTQHK